ncbi:MAG: Heimdall-CTERM domain-containing surface protein [Candidatus Hodarchaeales archaeon]|jgi:hypothetical protein
MKRKVIYGISVIMLLMVLTLTSPVKAATTEFAGHSFSEDYFAIEVDLVGDGTSVFDPIPEHPDLISDLENPSAVTGDSNEFEDIQFYLAYMNESGIETAFSALEKFEHVITLKDLIKGGIYDKIYAAGALAPDLRTALNTPISHINATAPFQQLVQHYTTSEDLGYKDVFVTNNFMALIAYSSSPDDQLMDSEDDLYLGYTFCVQNLTKAINDVTEPKGYEIGQFNYESSFKKTANGAEFGINYTNVFVLWQKIDIAPKAVDVFGAGSDYIKDDTGGIIFGGEIAAATVLDYISFEYVLETTTFIGANNYTEGRVTTHYNIGETNFLVTAHDDATFIADGIAAGNFTDSDHAFVEAPSYKIDIPSYLADYDFSLVAGVPDLPSSVTIDLPSLAFYLGDDAKTRMKMANGFGLTVATATTTFGVDVVDPSYAKDGDDLDLNMGGKTYFFTEFTGKKTYKLQGLEDLWGIDPTVDRPVHILPFDPDGWCVTGVAKAYFAVEFGLAYGFTIFMAKELGEFMSMSADATAYLSVMLYVTFTEFPEWYGGEIIHDPSYSAIAAVAAVTEDPSSAEESSGPPDTSEDDGVPGFEILSVLLAIPPLYAIYRKRRG